MRQRTDLRPDTDYAAELVLIRRSNHENPDNIDGRRHRIHPGRRLRLRGHPRSADTGAYIDDTAITATVKTRMLENEDVAGTSITVETLNGTVMLSGFAKSEQEKATAASIARKVDGVKAVKNEITVRK